MISAAKELLVDCEKMFSLTPFWERKVRARDFASMLSKLSSKATKLASFVTSAEAANLGDTLLNIVMRIEEQRSLFDRLHCTPEKFVMEELLWHHKPVVGTCTREKK